MPLVAALRGCPSDTHHFNHRHNTSVIRLQTAKDIHEEVVMAQVLLPCFLPSWPSVKEKIAAIGECQTVDELVTFMREIHDTSK